MEQTQDINQQETENQGQVSLFDENQTDWVDQLERNLNGGHCRIS